MKKFLLDENIPKTIERFLVDEGYNVSYVPRGASNHQIAGILIEEKATLITRNRDFSNTLIYPPSKFHGIILLKIHPPKPEKLIEALKKLFSRTRSFKGKLILVEEDKIKIIEG